MNKIIASFLAGSILIAFSACDLLEGATGVVPPTPTQSGGGGGSSNPLTNQEVVSGLKEALEVGIKKCSRRYFKNKWIFREFGN